MSLLKCLVCVSEKAANIARKCRQEKYLFELLVEEKKSEEANPRFVQDFKTLADVLIQQTVKHDVGGIFPDLRDHIKGEENNVFSNKLGETIEVDVLGSMEETSKLLEIVLDGNKRAADLLSTEVHKEINIDDVCIDSTVPDDIPVDIEKLGIWIDPIDSTAEYISGIETVDQSGIHSSGLRCVTVLIGVYNRITGEPVMGVVNQPFYEQQGDSWRGRCYWGVSLPNYTRCSLPNTNLSSCDTICLSSSESNDVKIKLKKAGFQLVEAAGAGYKLLSVITAKACGYILTKNSTFKWDTCGPQAILKSLGGDCLVLAYSKADCLSSLDYLERGGNLKIEKYCNEGGILAYRSSNDVERILRALI